MNLVLALALLAASSGLVWTGIEDPEGGPVEGFRRLLNDEPAVKRTSTIGAAFISQTVAAVSSAGAVVTPAVDAGTGGAVGSSASGTRGQVLTEANTWLGVPYAWGGNTRSGVDCSGFTKAVYATVGVTLPRVSMLQASAGVGIKQAQAQPGDLVAFGFPVHHVGIYVGNDQIIHAPHTGTVVRVESIWHTEPVYFRNVLGGAAPTVSPTAKVKAGVSTAKKKTTQTTAKARAKAKQTRSGTVQA